MSRSWYTQRAWDRIVGWGKVPKEYSKPEGKDDGKSEDEKDSDTSTNEHASE